MEMLKQYNCDLCKKVFNQKIDFTRHQNKKAPCISLSEIQQMNQTNISNTDNKTTIRNILNGCLDIMRDGEGLTGEKALRNLSYLLILKLIEPRLGNGIDIDNCDDYDFTSTDRSIEDVEKYKNKLLSIVRFSNLLNEKEDNIPNNMQCLWEDILSVHPTTNKIFLPKQKFNIQNKSTYKKLIDKLSSIDLINTDYDVLGAAYEDVIKDIMTGKVLGQFFTQPIVKRLMVNLLKPQIHPDGTIETCGDPTMGTGGFLITYLQEILKQAKIKNIVPDWNFIKTEGLYGKELEPDTYQLAVSNMLISSGHMFEQLDRGDSIREPITRKFDNILANPPFGIKGLNYDEIKSTLKEEYIPIKTDNAVSLFVQAIICMLKIGGKCAVVLPDGQDLFSKSNKTLVSIREYLLKTCDLKEIIYLPSGIFTNTSIKTCVFYFIKKREGTDVLETEIKYSKVNQKETGREYKFSKTHQTTNVKFYDFNEKNEEKYLLVEVPIEKLASNSYSFNYAEYMKDEAEEEQYEDGVVVKTLGELFCFNTGLLQAMKCDETNSYPVISSSDIHTHSEYKLDGENLFILKIFDGSANKSYSTKIKYFNGKCNFTSLLYHMNPINKDIINIKYIFYYLNNNITDISKKYQKGSCNKSLDLDLFLKYKIPIPSLEKQQEVVKYLDFIYEKANKTSQEKIQELKQLNEFCLNNQKMFGENIVKTLGEVCRVNQGIYIKPDMKIQGEFPVYGGGNASYYINQFNRENEIIVAKDGVSADCVRYEANKFFLNHHGWTIICKEQLIKKYMFYYLQLIQPELLSIAKGTAQLGINQENFYKIKIPIPSLDKQKEIVEYCEYNDMLVKQLEKEIENNKKQAQLFITSIVKTQSLQEEDHDDEVSSEINVEVQDEITSIEEEIVIEPKPKPKTKMIIKKKVKKPLIIEDEIEV